MAKLKDLRYDTSGVELEFVLSPSEFYAEPAEWITATLKFNAKNLPDIKICSDGQEVFEIEDLIKDIRAVLNSKKSVIDFMPLEPDYEFSLKHSGRGKYEKEDLYHVKVLLDASGLSGITYTGTGYAIEFNSDKKSLEGFANQLERELKKVKKEYLINEGKYIVNSVPYKE